MLEARQGSRVPTTMDLTILVPMLNGLCNDDGVGGVGGRHLGVAAAGKEGLYLIEWAEYLVDFGATDPPTTAEFLALMEGGGGADDGGRHFLEAVYQFNLTKARRAGQSRCQDDKNDLGSPLLNTLAELDRLINLWAPKHELVF